MLEDIKVADYKFATGVPQQPKVQPIEQLEPETPGTPKIPSGLLKREVRGKIAEIKGRIRIENYSEAKKLANILLGDLHDQGYSMWDVEIDSILKKIPIGGTNTRDISAPQTPLKYIDPKPKSEFLKENPKKYQREVRTQIAGAKAKIRKGDLGSAILSLTSLKKSMNEKGLYDFDKSIDDVLIAIDAPAKSVPQKQKVSDLSIAKKISEAERLLSFGKFPEAKRAFAAEGNSTMAQICSELIKSKRTITLYQSGLESAKRSSNKTIVATAIRELSSLLKMYKANHINSILIEELINTYK